MNARLLSLSFLLIAGILLFLHQQSPQFENPGPPAVTASLSLSRHALRLESAGPGGPDRGAAPEMGVVFSRPVTPALDFVRDLSAGRPFILDFSPEPGVLLSLNAVHLLTNRSGGWSFAGKVEGLARSWFSGTVQDDKFVLTVKTDDESLGEWSLLPSPEGHSLRRMDWTNAHRCGAPAPEPTPPAAADAAEIPEPSPQQTGMEPPVARDNGSEIDLLIVYTAAARIRMGGISGILAAMNQAVNDANFAFIMSNTSVSLRLVHFEEVMYFESTDLADLQAVQRPADLKIDGVHALRDTHKADIVSLWTDGNYGGIGYVFTSAYSGNDFAPYAFNVCNAQFAASSQTLAHECGHNLGCSHDAPNASVAGRYSYSYGWRGYGMSGALYRTIMSYTPGTRIAHFSNPDILHDGVPAGDAASSDNARTIRQTALTASNWRRITGLEISPALQNMAAAAGSGNVQVTALSGEQWTWSISPGSTWLQSAEPVSQTGTQQFTFSVAANTSLTSRQATVNFSAGGETFSLLVTQAGETPVLNVSPNFTSVPAEGGSYSVSVTSNHSWTWQNTAAWVTISGEASPQTGNQTFSFTVQPNPLTSMRVVRVYFHGSLSAYTEVLQSAAAPTLAVSGAPGETGAGGGSILLEVTSNGAWSWSASQPWITAAGYAAQQTGNLSMSFDVSPNPSALARSGTITFVQDTRTVQISVSQIGLPPTLSLSADSYQIPAAGGSYQFTVNSNTSWSWTRSAAWLESGEALTQTGIQTFSFTVRGNPEAADRTATFTLSAPGTATRTCTVTQAVQPPLQITSFAVEGGSFVLSYRSMAGVTAGIYTSATLAPDSWTALGLPTPGTGGIITRTLPTQTIPPNGGRHRYFRVQSIP